MAQIQAGYFFDGLKELFAELYDKNKVSGLLEYLSYFDLKTESDLQTRAVDSKIHSILSVASNIVSRGTPTKPSPYLEQVFSKTFHKTTKTETGPNTFGYKFWNVAEDFPELVFKALHIIDPRLTRLNQSSEETWQNFADEFEKDFKYAIAPEYFGEHIIQLLENDRTFDSVIRNSLNFAIEYKKLLAKEDTEFTKEAFDFCIENPYKLEADKGIAIEIDGENHEYITQNQIDKARDLAINLTNWATTVRIKKNDFNGLTHEIYPIRRFLQTSYFDTIEENYKNPLYNTDKGADAMQIALSPFAIARLQKTILEFIIAGYLSLNDSQWDIAVIERDIPGAAIAIDDLLLLIENLFKLTDYTKNLKLPPVNLKIFTSEEFADCRLNQNRNHQINKIGELAEANQKFDLVIDLSVLQRQDSVNEKLEVETEHFATIRSVYAAYEPKKVRTAKLIEYCAINDFKTNEFFQPKTEIIPALKYFVELIYRQTNINTEQIRFLDIALQLKSFLGISNAGTEKTTTALLAALLQPAISIIAQPVHSLIDHQQQILNRHGIDCHIEIDPYIADTQEDIEAHAKFTAGECLLLFTSPESFQTYSLRADFEQLDKNDISLAYGIVDEAHCISEWGHDFRSSYTGIGKHLRDFCKTAGAENLPILAFTASQNKNAHFDIQNEFFISDENTINLIQHRKEIKYILHKTNDVKHETDIWQTKQKVDEQKLDKLSEICHQYFYPIKIYTQPAPDAATVVFCFEKEGSLSVAGGNCEGVAEFLAKTDSKYKIARFVGTTGNNERSVNKLLATEAEQQQDSFYLNQTQLMVAEKSMGIGFEKQNIRHVLLLNIPNSIDSLLQIGGRAGKDSADATVDLLYNNQIFDYNETRKILDSKGYIIENKTNRNINFDLQTQLNYHFLLFRGRQKEKMIIQEFLNEISFPTFQPARRIKNRIYKEFGYDVTFEYEPEGYPYLLHIKTNKYYFGYIDFRDYSTHLQNINIDEKLATLITNLVKSEIDRACPLNGNQYNWLNTEFQYGPVAGIEPLLENLYESEEAEMIIAFRNDAVAKTAEMLSGRISTLFTENVVLEAYAYSPDPEQFIMNLTKTHEIFEIAGEFNIINKLSEMFFKIREETDTFTAIERLMTVQAIDDYFVDRNTGEIKIRVIKKNSSAYVNALAAYLEKYISHQAAMNVFSTVHSAAGDTIQEKCLNYLIDFIYDEIEPYRRDEINKMHDACIIAVKNGNKTFNEYIENYYLPCYANPYSKNNFIEDTQNFTVFKYSVLDKYLKLTGNKRAGWLNLYQSSNYFLEQFPNNYFFLLLTAYSSLLLHSNDNLKTKMAVEYLSLGFFEYKTQNNLSQEKFINVVQDFLNELYLQNIELKEVIEPYIYLRINTLWLENFNNKFLNGYGR